MRKPIAKKKPANVMMPPEYPGSKPRMLQKGKPINNPQATKLGTAADAAVGTVIGGLQGHRTAAQEKQRVALRHKSPGKGFEADVKDIAKTTTDFFKMKSPPPVPGPKMKKPRGR